MILDVTRHKFAEALLTLLFFAVAIAVAALFLFPDVSTIVGGAEAPLAVYIKEFRVAHPTLSPVVLGLLYVYTVLRLSRATVRVGLYPTTTLSAIALCSVMLFGALASNDYALLSISALLVAEAFGRLMYCFSHSVRPHFLFSAMAAFGAMPLVDKAFVPLALALPLLVLILRGTLRETLLTLLGLALPTFVYCYVVWLMGGDFGEAFMDVWGDNSISSHLSLATYMTIPRLVFLGFVLFLQLLTSVIYFSTPLSLGNGVRDAWRVMQFALVVLIVSLLFLPAASSSLIVAMVLLSAVMLPILFQYASAVNSALAYVMLIAAAFVPLFS